MLTHLDKAQEEYRNRDFLRAYDSYRRAEIAGGQELEFNARHCLRKFAVSCGLIDPLEPANLRIACILDNFSWQCFSLEARCAQLHPESALAELRELSPQILFVESAWHGDASAWEGKIAPEPSEELRAIISWCRARRIPALFWDKEGATSFERFIKSAILFDFIFTTDMDIVGDFKREAGHERVFLLPMACQPRIHNPIADGNPREPGFCFAGSWYKRFPERGSDIRRLAGELSARAPFVIYDRNYGLDSPATNWPEDMRKFIRGGLRYEEIARAYKGHEFGICINTIKQGQTMFARRAFELMASGTLVVSNYSRAMKVFFGDLAIVSDNPREIWQRLDSLSATERENICLRALRKIFSQHTYKHRLGQIIACCFGYDAAILPPEIICVAFVESKEGLDRALDNYSRQSYERKSLVLLPIGEATAFCQSCGDRPDISIWAENDKPSARAGNAWIAFFHSDDWYGAEYLTDLILATNYTDAACVGKVEYWAGIDDVIRRVQPGSAYRRNAAFHPRRALARSDILDSYESVAEWHKAWTRPDAILTGQAIDAFNYCQNGASRSQTVLAKLADKPLPDEGLSIEELLAEARKWGASKPSPPVKRLGKYELCNLLEPLPLVKRAVVNGPYHAEIDLRQTPGIKSGFWTRDLPVDKFKNGEWLRPYIPVFPEEGIDWRLRQLDEQGNVLTEDPLEANAFSWIKLSPLASWFRLGLEIRGPGSFCVSAIEFNKQKTCREVLLSNADYLLIAPEYPDYGDYYRLGFIHSRVRLYRQAGIKIDIFILDWTHEASFREFQGTNVISGDPAFLERVLSARKYRKVLIHFLGQAVWNIISRFSDIPRLIWLHGSEIQPWFRRIFNIANIADLAKAKERTAELLEFWPEVFASDAATHEFVFVSETFKNEVCADYGIESGKPNFHVIHNPVDLNIFEYSQKPAAQRHKVLMVHSFATPKYANDLAVKCILEMARHPDFSNFEFRIVGSGGLFRELTRPLERFANVILENRYVAQEEIARLHKDYGVFLIPTRRDSQGVSRDEAMASGLVPVTNNIDSIPEFVDESCAVLAPAEDYADMAQGIRDLGANPELFLEKSRLAHERASARSMAIIAEKEIKLIKGEPDAGSPGECGGATVIEADSVEAAGAKPKISVIMPCFNAAPYIGRAIESCRRQSIGDLEILAYDDCSVDATLDRLQSLAAADCRIRVFAGESNRGQGYGRNFLLARARGDYLTFLDSDDYFNNSKFLEDLYGLARASAADIVVSPHQFDRDGRISGNDLEERIYPDYSAAGEYLSRKFNTHGAWSKLFSRRSLREARFIEYGYGEDVIFGLRAFMAAKNVAATNIKGYVYYLDNISSCRPRRNGMVHFYSSLRLLAEVIAEWAKSAHKGNLLDIQGFLSTWKKDHLPRLRQILREDFIPAPQKAFLFDKFRFLRPFLIGICGYSPGLDFLIPHGVIEPDPAYDNYRRYLAELVCQFNEYFYVSEINGENRLFARLPADPQAATFMSGQLQDMLGGCYALEPFQPRARSQCENPQKQPGARITTPQGRRRVILRKRRYGHSGTEHRHI